MSFAACAEMVRSGDPDRFLSAMTAPPDRRGRLMALYAFNLEIARAPWVTTEPMLAEMRLQWWLDAVEEILAGKPPRRHEVVEPLAETITAAALPEPLLTDLITARRRDIDPAPLEDPSAYLDATSGTLSTLAAGALGARQDTLPSARDLGCALGAANLLRALPALAAMNRFPLGDLQPEAIRTLATTGLDHLSRARRTSVPRPVRAAWRAGWLAGPILRKAAADPDAAISGTLELSEFHRRGRLLLLSLTGGW